MPISRNSRLLDRIMLPDILQHRRLLGTFVCCYARWLLFTNNFELSKYDQGRSAHLVQPISNVG